MPLRKPPRRVSPGRRAEERLLATLPDDAPASEAMAMYPPQVRALLRATRERLPARRPAPDEPVPEASTS